MSPLVFLFAMQGGECARAQDASPAAQPPPVAAGSQDAVISNENAGQEDSPAAPFEETGAVQLIRRDAALGLSGWDHTLLGAFELGAKVLHASAASDLLAANSLLPSRKSLAVFSISGSQPRMAPFLSVSPLNQVYRNGMNVDMRSVFGDFNVTYREIFAGRPNTLGGGVGQASAAAMFTTPRFGSGGKLDFSAAALMGTGSINTLLGSGFGNSLIGGNGPGRKSQNSPTVAIKLTF